MNLLSATHTIYEIDAEKCKGCRVCAKKCPVNAISGELKEVHVIDKTVCIECGQCFEACRLDAVKAIEVPGRLKVKRKWDAWMIARRGVQFGLLALFFYLFFNTPKAAEMPVNIFSRANVLQAGISSIASRSLIANFWPALVVVALTLVFGRVWCGWICPTGTVFDLYGFKDRVFKWQGLRYVKYVLLAVIFIMALFGSATLMFFEPITVLVRGLVGGIVPVAKDLIAGVAIDWTKVSVGAAVLLIFALLANIVERRFWCRYICPLGATIGLLSKFSLFKRKVADTCVKCGHCTQTCPMGAINHDDFKNDPAECIVCMDCVPHCPTKSISFDAKTTPTIAWGNEFDPTRREAFVALGTGALAVGLLKSPVNTKGDPSVLRPPGVVLDEEGFFAKCIRCDQCVQACKSGLIVPAAFESGWQGTLTPIVKIEGKYCDYDCNACTQVCPSGAIPHLTLEEKRRAPIGIVVIDRDKCIDCMICEDACPASAIEREEYFGKYRNLKARPVVNPDLCTGCNRCTFDCPMECMTVVSRKIANA